MVLGIVSQRASRCSLLTDGSSEVFVTCEGNRSTVSRYFQCAAFNLINSLLFFFKYALLPVS